MSNDVSPARGFRDYPPTEKAKRDRVLGAVREVYAAHGFSEIETPVVEPIERLRGSDGGDNVGMIFAIQRRGLTAEQVRDASDPHDLCDLGLRYDLTVPLSRFYASESSRLPQVARLIQIAPVWRAERPQKGRFRQFTQCDIDIIGERGPIAEVELIATTLAALTRIGIERPTVRLNDRRFLKALLASRGVRPEQQAATLVVIDKIDKIGTDGVRDQLAALDLGGDAAARLGDDVDRFVGEPIDAERFHALIGDSAPEALEDHLAIMDGIRAVAPPEAIRFDPTLVRGLGYYTGSIFEIEHPDSGSSIAGGGRYDGMVGRFLGRDVPACGFSLGFERLLQLVPDAADASSERIALVYPSDAAIADVLREKQQLIDRAYHVTLVPRAKNMRRVLDDVRLLGIGGYVALGSTEVRPLG